MKIAQVTITGIDGRTPPLSLWQLSQEFPFVEWGLLLSRDRQGKEPRYPGRWYIDCLLDLDQDAIDLSLHLCGELARELAKPTPNCLGRVQEVLDQEIVRFAKRIQINGCDLTDRLLRAMARYKDCYPHKDFIVQCQHFPLRVPDEEIHGYPDLLVDRSGGRGFSITNFPLPTPGLYCGYAGGIGPHNVAGIASHLTSLKPGLEEVDCWIDMETNVRTADWLDLGKVRQVLEAVKPYVTA